MGQKDASRLSIRAVSPEQDDLELKEIKTKIAENENQEGDKAAKNGGSGGISNFIRVLKLGDSFDYAMMVICAVSALGTGIAMPMMFLVFGKLVGDFASYFAPNTPVPFLGAILVPKIISKEQFMKQLDKNTTYMVYLGIARFALQYISMLSIRVSGLRISARLRLLYLRALLLQPVTTIDETSAGAIATRLTTNINTIESGISQQFSLAIQATAFTIGLYVVAFIKSAVLTLVASAAIPIVLIVWGLALPFSNKYWYAAEAIKEQASSLAFEIFESIRIVVAFGAEDHLGSKHREMLQRAGELDRKQGPILGFMQASMFFGVYATFALAIWFGIKQYIGGHIDGINTIIGEVLFSVLWAVMCISRLYSPLIRIFRASIAAQDIFSVLDAQLEDISGLKDSAVPLSNDIVFRDVRFAYPSRPDTIILNGLNVRFEAGKTTAIVGPSGSGKSTIVGLLERWYKPMDGNEDTSQDIFNVEDDDGKEALDADRGREPCGEIFVGSIKLKDIDTKWWRSNIGLVQQEPFLFNDTIFRNIANGLAGTTYEEAPDRDKLVMVQNACQEAFADEFIRRLPMGYLTSVGEGGMKLSGGQRQRIAIARAIIKQPQILILDEATSAIDVRTEKIVQKALDRVSQYRTTIVIAHRLATIRKADKIVVVSKGQVVEQGTHGQLLRDKEGIYSGFVRAQAVEAGKDEVDSDLSIEQEEDDIAAHPETLSIGHSSSESNNSDIQKRQKRGLLGSFGLLLYEQRSRWLLYAFTILGAIGGGATYPLQAYLFAKVVACFTLVRDQLIQQGNYWAMWFAIQAVGIGMAFMVLGWSSSIISMEVSAFYRQDYLENLLQKRISFFDEETNSSGTLTSQMSTDSNQVQQLLGNEMGMAMVAVLSIVGSIIIAFAFGWKLSLVGVFAIMPLVLIAGYYRVHLEQSFDQLNAIVFAESSQFGSEAISGFRTVTALIMEDSITKRFDKLLTTHVTNAIQKAKWSTIVFAFSDSADMFCQALCFWYGGRLLANREYDIVNFFVIYMAVVQSSLAAGMWFSFSPNIVEATAAANRMISVRPSPAEKQKKSQIMPLGSGPVGIEFQDVWFYKDRDVPVLKGINLKIEPGQFAAFVGASGSGKSTTISLLERFYDPTSGRILFANSDVTEVEPRSYRKNLSLVAQESTLYEGTIRENIALSVDESEATDEAIERACMSAQIHDFIVSLPGGYSTHIGSKGIALSGGQRQRLALARALLRSPQLLLLDEATSNLDSESEQLVQHAIEHAAGEGRRTIIAVAHRLATIQKADVIFVLGSGRVLEAGSHATLLAKRGVYYQMCQAQALDR